ncbi:hypothetical protein GAMM_40152 [Gammaproteobacteria bacterium]
MKKVIVLTYEGIYSTPLIEGLIKNSQYKVVRIIKSGTLYGNKSHLRALFFLLKKTSIFFLGAKFFEMVLSKVYMFLIKKKNRPFKTVKELSTDYSIPFDITNDINLYFKEDYKDTILFSVYFNQVVSQSTLDKFHGAYNIHPAPLPEGRGLFSQFWLLIGKATIYYQTIHHMTGKIDSGEVIMQKSCLVKPTDNISMADYMNKVTILGIDMMKNIDFSKKYCEGYKSGRYSYNSFPKTKDVINFWKLGCRFFYLSDIFNFLNIKE